jgi:hypothetical protein
MQDIKEIGDWYIMKHYAYIRIYVNTCPPHLLPKYIPEKLLIREITYQTVEVRVTTMLSTNSKRYRPRLPIIVGKYNLTNVPHAKKEEESMK